jgi:Zn-dependent protease
MTFHLGKIPVRVLPSFFLLMLFFNIDSSPARLALWAGVVFVSILVHELGHATVCLAYGLEPRIELHGMGGTTSWSPRPLAPLAAGQQIAISLAGPFAGFALYALVLGVKASGQVPASPMASMLFADLAFVNGTWGVVNLLPMLPLDGGNALAQGLNALTKGRGERPALITSMVVAVLLFPLALFLRWTGPVTLLGPIFIVVSNWRRMQALAAREHDAPLRAGLEGAYKALEAKDAEQILALARPIALGSKTPQVRAEALQLMAFGFLLSGRVEDADAAIAGLPAGFTPHASLTALRESAGRGDGRDLQPPRDGPP